MKTIAQQLNVKEFPFKIKDSNNNQIYFEDSSGYWEKREFDSNNNEIYYEVFNSKGYWSKREFDSNNNQIYVEDSNGYWSKREYDVNNNQIYYESSNGKIIDNRPKQIPEYTIEELQKLIGKEFKIVKG
jgi:hypothetical protein